MSSHRYVEDAVRRKWHEPETTLREIGLRAGMVFMDIGCGDGFFAVPAARLVGEKGKVYALDADASTINKLKHEARDKDLRNLNAAVGAAEEVVFCNECADMVFYSIVLHDFRDPAKVLHNAKRMIKPSGVLVNLDWKKKPMSFGPPVRIRFSEEQSANLIKAAGFRIQSVRDVGRYHYIVTAKP